MQISSNQITAASLQAAYGKRPQQATTAQANTGAAHADVVTISSAARQAQAAEQHAAAGPLANDPEADVAKYQIPDWLASYGMPVANRLGVSGNGFEEHHPEAARLSSAERKQYAEAIEGHYQAVLTANGISGAEQHYQATIVDPQRSDALRSQFQQRIQGDAALLELMGKLGKALPG